MSTDLDKAKYIVSWIDRLNPQKPSELRGVEIQLRDYWLASPNIDLGVIRTYLWSWVQSNGGGTDLCNKRIIYGRILLCLAYEDIDEALDVGFFEDLLRCWGISEKEIIKYDTF
jgi:hypothetical protein